MKTKLGAAISALVLCGALFAGAGANAAVGVYNFDITTSNYIDFTAYQLNNLGTPTVAQTPPLDHVNFNFDVTFDPDMYAYNLVPTLKAAADPAFDAFEYRFYYATDVFGAPLIELFGFRHDVNAESRLDIRFGVGATLSPGVYSFMATNHDYGDYYFYSTQANPAREFNARVFNSPAGVGQLTITQVSSAPEPGTWTMMLLGLGGLGAFARRARRHGAGALV